MTFDEFIDKYLGKTVGYPGSQYLGECLSLVKRYIEECFGIAPPPSGCNAARCYWSKFPGPLGTRFKKVPYVPGLIPQNGWIAVWNESVGGGYGHISIVKSASFSSFFSLDANWGGNQAHLVNHDYFNLYGFLVPLAEEGNMDMYKGYDLENKDSMRVAVDVLVRVQAGELVDRVKVEEAYQKGIENGKLQGGNGVNMNEWTENGITIEKTDGNTKTITNYKRK